MNDSYVVVILCGATLQGKYRTGNDNIAYVVWLPSRQEIPSLATYILVC